MMFGEQHELPLTTPEPTGQTATEPATQQYSATPLSTPNDASPTQQSQVYNVKVFRRAGIDLNEGTA